MKAMVLCAGVGTRLGALTMETPKPLLPLAGRPLLAYTLRYLKGYGFRYIIINLHFMPEKIRAAFGDGSDLGLELAYSYEPALLGTAGGPKQVASLLREEEHFLLVYGDLLIDQDLGELARGHLERGADATILLHRNPGSNSLVELDASRRIVEFIERPTEAQRRAHPDCWVNSGVYVLRSELLDVVPAGVPCDFPRDVFPWLVKERLVLGFPLAGYRCAIDSPQRYEEAAAAVCDGSYRSPFGAAEALFRPAFRG